MTQAITIRERHPHFTNMPPYCASCGSQQPGARYIDFDSAFDGPVLNREDGIAMQIDDLIVCEDCVRSAAMLLGLADPERDSETLARAQRELLALQERLKSTEQYADRLESALHSKPGKRAPRSEAAERNTAGGQRRQKQRQVQDVEPPGDDGDGVTIERLA